MTRDDIHEALETLTLGTPIKVKLDDGATVTGNYAGTGDGKVLLEDADGEGAAPVELGKVENVLMDISSEGPE